MVQTKSLGAEWPVAQLRSARLAGDIREFVARHLTSRRVAIVALATIALLLVPEILRGGGIADIPLFDYNGEQNVPAAVSSVMLMMAALATAMLTTASPGCPGRTAGRTLAIVFLFMAFDEFGQIHEKLERISGVDWQVLYLPLVAVAGVATLMTLTVLSPNRRTRLLFAAGACSWAAGWVLEAFEYGADDRRVAGYDVMVLFEENFELLGSLLFALAMLVAFELATRRPPATTPRPVPARHGGSRPSVIWPDARTPNSTMRPPEPPVSTIRSSSQPVR